MTDDDEYSIFYGFGSVMDLREAYAPQPRLLGMKSVSNAAAWAMHKTPKAPESRPIGFHRPKR